MTIEIASRLAKLRKEHNLSQEELAEKLGLSRQAVSKWERAEASPDTDNLIMLAKLYDISLDELLHADAQEYAAVEQEALDKAGEGKSFEKPEVVHIGLKGIHVEDGENYVHVGWDGIHVRDDKGNTVETRDKHVFVNDREYDVRHEVLRHSVIPVVIVIAYLLLGFLGNWWHPGWLIFLLVPVLDSLVEAIVKRDPNKFAYPVLAALAFLGLGLFRGLWHPGWVVFLTLPIYYAIFPNKRARKDYKKCFPDGQDENEE